MRYQTLCKFFIVAGFLFVAGGYYVHGTMLDFLDRAIEVDGTVIRMERSSEGTHKPVVEFTDHTGVKRTHYSRVSTSPPRFFEGEEVKILYDPEDPKYPVNARIKSGPTLWGLTGFLYIFGAAWILIASFAWYIASKGGVIYFTSSKEKDTA